MRVFVCGGTGFVGGHLRSVLAEMGHEVRLLVHRRGVVPGPGEEPVEGDVMIPATFAGALRGCDALINLVGIIREYPGRLVTFERLHGEATRNLVNAAATAGVKRYLQMSALGTGPQAVSAYHRSKFRAEEHLRGSALDWTIFRPAIIFGPGDAFVTRLAGLVRGLPVVPVIGDGEYRLQPVSVTDVARCFAMALGMAETVGRTYELCGPDRLSFNDLIDTIGKALARERVAKLHQPLPLMKAIVPVLQRLPFFPITMDQLQMLVEGNVCDGKWQEAFRFEPERFAGGITRYLKP